MHCVFAFCRQWFPRTFFVSHSGLSRGERSKARESNFKIGHSFLGRLPVYSPVGHPDSQKRGAGLSRESEGSHPSRRTVAVVRGQAPHRENYSCVGASRPPFPNAKKSNKNPFPAPQARCSQAHHSQEIASVCQDDTNYCRCAFFARPEAGSRGGG